jgi:hypothetical protein
MPRSRKAAAIIAAATLALAAVPALGASAARPPVRVIRSAWTLARHYGDPHPARALVVQTTHSLARRVTGDSPLLRHDPNPRVWLVVFEGGHFVGDRAPSDAALPRGTVLTLTFAPGGHSVVYDLGITNQAPALSGLRGVRALPRR